MKQIRKIPYQGKFLIVRVEYNTYGVGETEELAIKCASHYLRDEYGNQGNYTPDEVREMLVPLHDAIDGDLVMLAPKQADNHRD